MESLQTLKSRLGAVKNIGQITKAMEVVSATKMRKAQTVALMGRPYAFRALELLAAIVANAPENALQGVPLAEKRDVLKTLVIVVTSDRGLAGSFNSQVFRAVERFMASDIKDGYEFIAVGKKAVAYLSRKGFPVVDSFVGFGDFALPEETAPLAELLLDGFLSRKFDRVVTVSTHFRSTLKQETLVREVLPISFEKISEVVKEIVPERGKFAEPNQEKTESLDTKTDYIFEPTPLEALSALIPHLVRMQLLHLVLEANASEHSARMVAMKSASDNAKELAVGLSLEYNKARQAGITKEIIEITSTQAALG